MNPASLLNHMRPAKTNVFFKGLNNNTNNTDVQEAKDLEYITSMNKKYSPRKLKIADPYLRMLSLKSIKTSLAYISVDDLVELCILSPSSFDLAMLLWKQCGQQYKCIDLLNQTWQRLTPEGEWITDTTVCLTLLRNEIYDTLMQFFVSKQKSIKALLDDQYLTPNELRKPLELKLTNVNYIVNSLGSITMKNFIIKEALELFYSSELI